MGWPQGLASPCACIWALVARIAVVCCTDLCGSLPWTDHCFVHYLGSLLLQFSLVTCCYFANSAPSPSHPYLEVVHDRYWVRKVSLVKFLQCDGAGWWPLAGLVPAHRVTMEPAVPGICTGPPTNLGWHQFPSSTIGNEFNQFLIFSLASSANVLST